MQLLHLVTSEERMRQSALATLDEIRKEIEAGDVIAVSGIAELNDGTYRSFGSATMSRLQTAAALLECAISRLGE